MGIFSNLQSFHEAGERPTDLSLEQYGEPYRSLYTSAKLASIHQQIDIFDEHEEVVYQTSSKIFSLRGKTDIFDTLGNLVAHIERKLFSLHEIHYITMANGRQFTLSNELFHIVDDITNIEELGWQLRGNILALNFVLVDQYEQPIAAIGQKILSIHNKFSIDLYQPEYEHEVVAIVIALQKMLQQREANNAVSSSSASSNG